MSIWIFGYAYSSKGTGAPSFRNRELYQVLVSLYGQSAGVMRLELMYNKHPRERNWSRQTLTEYSDQCSEFGAIVARRL